MRTIEVSGDLPPFEITDEEKNEAVNEAARRLAVWRARQEIDIDPAAGVSKTPTRNAHDRAEEERAWAR